MLWPNGGGMQPGLLPWHWWPLTPYPHTSGYEILHKAQVWSFSVLKYVWTASLAWHWPRCHGCCTLIHHVVWHSNWCISHKNCTNWSMRIITVLHSLKALIDDIVVHASTGPYAHFNELLEQASIQVQWWGKLVKVTRGSLNPKKCCTIAYEWCLFHKVFFLRPLQTLIPWIRRTTNSNSIH